MTFDFTPYPTSTPALDARPLWGGSRLRDSRLWLQVGMALGAVPLGVGLFFFSLAQFGMAERPHHKALYIGLALATVWLCGAGGSVAARRLLATRLAVPWTVPVEWLADSGE